MSAKIPRGLRNNNPLNIRISSSEWKGRRINPKDKEFVEFVSMEYGFRAAWKVLETYWVTFWKQRIPFCINNIIQRWAPPSENNTRQYISSVCKISGLGAHECLPRPKYAGITYSSKNKPYYGENRDLERMCRLMAAMAVVECGIDMSQIDIKTIEKAWGMAFPDVAEFTTKYIET